MENFLIAAIDAAIDIKQVFAGAPLIYLVLASMSVTCAGLWIYSLLLLRKKQIYPPQTRRIIRQHLLDGNYPAALLECTKQRSIYTDLLQLSIESQSQNPKELREMLREEGERISRPLWQKAGFVNDIAIIAPMLGLLGTVVGMFYAFYNLNRSAMSLTTLFDGLGVSVGTTVAGLIVSLFAMALYISLKFRLIKSLTQVETDIIETMRQRP